MTTKVAPRQVLNDFSFRRIQICLCFYFQSNRHGRGERTQRSTKIHKTHNDAEQRGDEQPLAVSLFRDTNVGQEGVRGTSKRIKRSLHEIENGQFVKCKPDVARQAVADEKTSLSPVPYVRSNSPFSIFCSQSA